MTAAIHARELTYAWPNKPALLDVRDFRIERGERVFLRGPSGSGKSTLLGLLGGVLEPDSGHIELAGTDITPLSASARDRFRGDHLGFIFQMFNLIPYLGVLDNVVLPARFSAARAARVPNGDLEGEARRLLDALGLGARDIASRPVTELSIGQQQRVAAARALEPVWASDMVPPQALTMLGRLLVFDAAKARRELGWTPEPFETVLRRSLLAATEARRGSRPGT